MTPVEMIESGVALDSPELGAAIAASSDPARHCGVCAVGAVRRGEPLDHPKIKSWLKACGDPFWRGRCAEAAKQHEGTSR